MSSPTRKREALGARRGGTARRLAETAALEEDTLRNPGGRSGSTASDVNDNDVSVEPPAKPTAPVDANEASTIKSASNEKTQVAKPELQEDGGEASSEGNPEPSSFEGPATSLLEPKPRQRSDFRDALQIQAWTTSQDLWDRYANLALKIRKETGQRVATSELIRAVLEQHMPNAETRTGVSALAGYAERWTEERSRTKTTQKAGNFRLRRRDAEALERAQLELLEDRGTNFAIGRMISGIVSENFPTASEAKRLLRLS